MARAALVGLVVAGAVFAVAMVTGGGADLPAKVASDGSAPRGLDVFTAMGCGSCHRLAAASSTGEIGPDLDKYFLLATAGGGAPIG